MEQILKKKILLVSQNFYPENFKSNDIAWELAKRGYDVEVLTGIPNYPEGKYPTGYGIFKKRIEVIDGVKIYRCFQIPRGKKYAKFLLPLTYLSFMLFGSILALFLAAFKKYDLVIVHQVSPITQTLPAIIVKKIQKIPMVLWVLDLWPEAFISGTGFNNKIINELLSGYVNFSYGQSDKILVSSKGFIEPVKNRIKNIEKIKYFPNWSENLSIKDEKETIPQLPEGFKIMLAGNLGVSQNLENVMQAALKLKKYGIRWIILGDGSKRKWMEDFISENDLDESVFLLGKFPPNKMSAFYEQADMMLLSLSNKYDDLKMVIPARLQSYMAAGKPVLGFVDGEAGKMIKEAQCGYVSDANNVEEFVQLVINISSLDKKQLTVLGKNGQNYFNKYFRKEVCINNLADIINKLW